MQEEKMILRAPRNFIIFFIQYMAIVPFCTAFGFIILPFLSKTDNNIYDIISLFLIVAFFLVVGILLLYFPQNHRAICIYDRNNKVLSKSRKNNVFLTCDLSSVNKILLRITKEDIGVNIKVLLEKSENNWIELYVEQSYLGYKQWMLFANKLSNITSLPLETEKKNMGIIEDSHKNISFP